MQPLTFSSRSWHIRLMRWWVFDYQPRDLCHHFWAVVGLLGSFAMLASLVGGALALWVFMEARIWQNSLLMFVAVNGGILIVVLPSLTLHKWRHRSSHSERHEPGLVRQWLTARKQRWCPLIEVKEE